jgi:N-acetyl-1-D-myo-inositol-2-amino-2-deoxy-alpha-D-glucopyranoside deacetylase
MSAAPDRRLLLVHAHPDDESINNGASMAKYASEGVRVTLVTCTLGEEGEVIPAELRHLEPGPPDRRETARPSGDLTPLARHRKDELAAAMRELGVTDHRLLGGPGRYRDSGMMGFPTNDRADCFWQAPLDAAALHLVRVIREVRPQVMVTYDPDGGYGHPDHIKAHRVAMRAAELAPDRNFAPEDGEPHEVSRIYWNCVPRPVVDEGLARLRTETPPRYRQLASPEDVPGVVPDASYVDVTVDAREFTERKAAAMRAHATQVAVDGDAFALSNELGQPLLATEYYRLANATGGRTAGARDDLFAGAEGADA